MTVTHEIKNNICVVDVHGSLQLDRIMKIKDYVTPFTKDDAVQGIVIKNITVVDSSGFGLIISLYQTLQKRNAKLALCQVSQMAYQTFEFSEVNAFINIYSTEEEALAAL